MARTRPGSDRPLRVTETEPPDDPDEEPDDQADEDGQQPPTSLEDLTTEADPQQFDQTFVAGDASLTIQGRFDPVAGARQVIPRVAYVLNYNLVYNPDRDRWEPQKKSRLTDSRTATVYQAAGNDQSLPDNGDRVPVEFTDAAPSSLDGADPGSNQIVAPTDGEYLISIDIRLTQAAGTDDLNAVAQVDGTNVLPASSHTTSDGPLNLTATGVATATENDPITVGVNQRGGAGVSTLSGRYSVFLQVTRLRGPPP